jgi:hypothetical protein
MRDTFPRRDPHPLTQLIPVRTDQDALVIEIAQDGIQEPVYLYERKIIEGRVRYAACEELGVEPPFRDWVLLGEKDPLDWMVRRHIQTHELSELDKIRLTAAVVPFYREMKGQTNKLLYQAMNGLSWNKIRAINWLEEAGALDAVLSGEKDVFEAARSLGLASDKRGVALGKSYGAGDKFDESFLPAKRYLAAWKRKGYEFRHLNPKEATRRLSLIDSLAKELQAARSDLAKRAVAATLSAPPERRRP